MMPGPPLTRSSRSDPQFAQNARWGTASPLFGCAVLEEETELGLGVEAHRHAAFAVGNRDAELIALTLVAASLLNQCAWPAWMFAVVPGENLHRSARPKQR